MANSVGQVHYDYISGRYLGLDIWLIQTINKIDPSKQQGGVSPVFQKGDKTLTWQFNNQI